MSETEKDIEAEEPFEAEEPEAEAAEPIDAGSADLAVEAEAAAEDESDDDDEPASNVVTPSATGRLESILESLLFAADRPITAKQLQQMTSEQELEPVIRALDQLVVEYEDRGIVLHEVAGGYQFRTAPANAAWVTHLVAGKPVRLTRAQLESLAIIAYRQPITRPEIEDIRGVDTGSSLRVLLERNLIRILGKKEEPGRPMLYGTTKDFLEFFNLRDLRELPTLREFHELTEDSMREVEKLGLDAEQVAAEVGKVADPEVGEDQPPEGESSAAPPPAGGGEDPGAGDAERDLESETTAAEADEDADNDEDVVVEANDGTG